ncbi:uncharacterized protein LOC108604104 isoform X2 [Drosophila busckii]|uniref:uncharacterized protein LOC108604104 isoform X2 n=1 Tax=Drosophila busckii TaxID=30019 RepID=UPI00083ED4A4|nr:uncharacterized protein LOC108604104 isoform X2 [Drosophila busckii]XP_017848875.1 uncharacterized protein LOC108604104 isoform X2 [Drosophila busckii]
MELIKKYKQRQLSTGDVRKLNHIVICLMVLVAIISIIWSVSLHMLSGDFYDGIISAKIIFKQRDFAKLDNKSKEILQQDLVRFEQLAYGYNEKPQMLQSDSSTTKKPKYKFAHIYEPKDYAPQLARLVSHQELPATTTTTSATPQVAPNAELDRKFLASQSVDTFATRWSTGFGAQFVYAFPFISEIVAIIWTAMCLIYQTGHKKTSVLPKPWRIVVPSIVMFTLMTVSSIAYTILTNGYLKRLCSQLRQELTNSAAISCGDAMSLLRPFVNEHRISHDAYLQLFRCSYIVCLVLWLLALLLMLLRYSLALDFQLVDIEDMFEQPVAVLQPVYTEVQQSSPRHEQQQTQARPKSDEDYQSAKSRLSDVAMPLLELKLQDAAARPLTSHSTTQA